MRIEIRLGQVFKDGNYATPGSEEQWYEYDYKDWSTQLYKDNFKANVKVVYDIVERANKGENILIDNCDHFVTYLVNNCLFRKVVENEIKRLEDVEMLELLPPVETFCDILEIDEDGKEVSILTEDHRGCIGSNWFDKQMKIIMDDFYRLLNFYWSEDEKED